MIYPNFRKPPEELITPQEITAIMDNAGDLDDIRRAEAIAAEYIKMHGGPQFPIIGIDFDLLNLLANIYQGGRLQGIREQKAKQKAKAAPADKGHPETEAEFYRNLVSQEVSKAELQALKLCLIVLRGC